MTSDSGNTKDNRISRMVYTRITEMALSAIRCRLPLLYSISRTNTIIAECFCNSV